MSIAGSLKVWSASAMQILSSNPKLQLKDVQGKLISVELVQKAARCAILQAIPSAFG